MGRTFDTVYEEHRSTVCGEHLWGERGAKRGVWKGGGKRGGKAGGRVVWKERRGKIGGERMKGKE